MFPLPQLPTDNLYKLVTIAGLAMIVGAFSIIYGQDRPFVDSGLGSYARISILRDRLIDQGLNPQPLPDSIGDESVRQRYEEYRDLIRMLPSNSPIALELRGTNEQLLLLRTEIRFNRENPDGRMIGVWSLLSFGSAFLVGGFFWWHRSYQRHQDEIMYLSALEARQKFLKSLKSDDNEPAKRSRKTAS
jgi:hypothetical protein